MDGVINPAFAETLTEAEVLAAYRTASRPLCSPAGIGPPGIFGAAVRYCQNSYVIAANESDKVAVRELQQLRAHQIDDLNQQVLHGMYAQDGAVIGPGTGQSRRSRLAALNTLLSTICRMVFAATPVLRNELVNRQNISGGGDGAEGLFQGVGGARG